MICNLTSLNLNNISQSQLPNVRKAHLFATNAFTSFEGGGCRSTFPLGCLGISQVRIRFVLLMATSLTCFLKALFQGNAGVEHVCPSQALIEALLYRHQMCLRHIAWPLWVPTVFVFQNSFAIGDADMPELEVIASVVSQGEWYFRDVDLA